MPGVRVGSDQEEAVGSEGQVTEDDEGGVDLPLMRDFDAPRSGRIHPTPPRFTTPPKFHARRASQVGEISTEVEVVNLSPVTETGEPSMDQPGVVLETFPPGFCYLGLFEPEHRPEAEAFFKANPSVGKLLAVSEGDRRRAVGVVSRTPGGPADYHLSFEEVGVNLWRELERLDLEDHNATIGALEDEHGSKPHDLESFGKPLGEQNGHFSHISGKNRARFGRVFQLVLPCLAGAYVVRALAFDRWQLLFTVIWLVLALSSALFFDALHHSTTRTIVRLLPLGLGEFVIILAQTGSYWTGQRYTTLLVYYLGLAVRSLAVLVMAWRQLGEVMAAGTQIKDAIGVATCSLVEATESVLGGRQFQSGSSPLDRWAKALLNLLASFLRALSLTTHSAKTRRTLEKLASHLQTMAQSVDLPKAVRGLWSTVGDTFQQPPTEADGTYADWMDISDEIAEPGEFESVDVAPCCVSDRSFQAGDGIPQLSCRHLVTKGNINGIVDAISSCEPGSVHIVTAATGTGKSTAIPYLLSCDTSKPVYVVIPTIAAARSSAQVITDRFGVRPNVQVNSTFTEGDCNLWVVTSKTMAGKMIHNPGAVVEFGGIIFDEMHVNSAENDLFRRISPRLATKMPVLWCSATFSQSFTLPGDLSHPVAERIDRSVTLQNVFTSRCKVKGVTPSTIRGRYLVFCASKRDTEFIKARFKGSSIPAFALSSANYKTTIREVENALKDPANTTVIIAATPCMETGVTLPFNYSVDFREQIVPAMTFDPNALSTKRVPVTQGMAVQRKGRVGRMFRGIYIAPPVEFTPATQISESDWALANVYARLFGYESPVRRDLQFLDEQKLTDSFISNVFATRLDPIAVAGMSTPEGRIFKSFADFTFPADTDKSKIVFSDAYFPEDLWRSWPSFETEEWKQFIKSENRWQHGKSVRAPFWDYTQPDTVQIDNWQLKVLCYPSYKMTDAIYNDKRFLSESVSRSLKRSPLWLGVRSQQANGDDLFSSLRVPGFGPGPEPFVPPADEGPQPGVGAGGRQRPPLRPKVDPMPFVPAYVYARTMVDADWTVRVACLFVVLATLLAVCSVTYGTYRWVSSRPSVQPQPLLVDEVDGRALEKEAVSAPASRPFNPKRPYEKRQRNWMPSGAQLDPHDFVTLDFGDGRPSRRVKVEDLDRECDEYYDDRTWAPADWSEDHVTVTGRSKDGRDFSSYIFESESKTARVVESAVPAKTPNYSLRAARSSVVSFSAAEGSSHVGYGVIVRGFIFLNSHVLAACGDEVRMHSARGEHVFRPCVAWQAADLTVVLLPGGVAGSAANFSFRSPEPGEEVVLVRCKPNLNAAFEPTPSESSFATPAEGGIFSYVINTKHGDCGTPVISTKDGAFVGLHSLGGSHMDQANFMTPITSQLVAELGRRIPQRSLVEPIAMPPVPTAAELSATACVAPEEQAKHPIKPFSSGSLPDRFPGSKGGYVSVASLQKRVSTSSKIVFDHRAGRLFAEGRSARFCDLSDYCPSDLSEESYWKDVAKYNRSPQVLPDDYDRNVLPFFELMSPWMFQQQDLIPVQQVYFDVDKQKSSGPRLTGKKGFYMSSEESASFADLVARCESLYDVTPDQFVAPVWQVAIKDELRDIDRVLALKTRTFMSAPIETILGNMRYVAAFNERFVDNHLQFPSTLGIDKFYGGWDRLADYLGKADRVYWSGDGSRFDSSVSVQHLSMNCHIRCQSVAPRYRRHLRNLYSETVYTPLVMGDGIVRVKNTGNPSGSLNTGVENSMALQGTTYYALGSVLGWEEAKRALADRDVVFVVNGDDIAFAVAAHYFKPELPERIQSAMKACGMTYVFTKPSSRIEDLVYLSHGFQLATVEGRSIYIPVLEPARIVASCLFQRKVDAVSTHMRYTSALIHAYPHPRLYPYVLKLVREFLHEAMLDRPFVSASYERQFPLFDRIRIEELYGLRDVGSAGETYSHKRQPFEHFSTGRTYQAMSLESEHKEQPLESPRGLEDPLREAETSEDLVTRPTFSAPVKRVQFGFTRGMDPTIGELFSKAIAIRPVDRPIVSKATRHLVEQSIAALRDLLSVDDATDMQRVFARLLIYYGDNSTSERNPHIFPFEWKEREVSYNDIDKCLRPTPRKFWRALADVTKKYLEEHHDVIFHWAHMHGFPMKYRKYGFDTADFCSDIPDEARLAVQASKDAALTRSPYNLMRADLKAVGFGGGTIVEQITGSQFGNRGPGKSHG